MRAIRRFTVRPVLPEPLAPLAELATNLRWCWDPETQDLFAALDPEAWHNSGHDPVRTLGSASSQRLQEMAEDRGFLRRLELVAADLHDYLTGDGWFQRSGAAVRQIAYFSSEFGIDSVLPQYSGGLGILAGDHLKTASDLGVPLVGVGLFYRHGYFRQSLSAEGWQQEDYPVVDPDGLPLRLLRDGEGNVETVSLDVPAGTLTARIWVAQVGRVPLLLLDSDIEQNPEELRGVTDRLYGGTTEHRLRQELLLGVGGVRALRAWSRVTGAPDPEVFHANEGHAGFLGVERIRELSVADGGPHLDFDAALEVARAGTVFTTHTPVPAGIDRFPRELVEQYFAGQSPTPGVPVERVLALGAEDFEGGDGGVFNMAVMGFRLAQRANGVSQLHGHVSREMFQGLWRGFDEAEVPIGSITNGVHAPTWVAREMQSLGDVERVPADTLWSTKRELRARLVSEVRERLRASWSRRGATPAELDWIDGVMDPDVLTVGFARRVPSYKRLTLMLRDPERLKRLLLHPERPVQLVIAGKAHPADEGGKRLIQDMVRFADDESVRHRIVFLPNYDIAMAKPMYPGCDVWLNNPLRPYEACGTSGMKAALNGGLNLSILDGWWDEWFGDDFGWAIPSADGVENPDRRDDIEAHALYQLLENEIAPRFYDVDNGGVPLRWVEMLRRTLTELGPKVLSTRMVEEYVDALYVPAAASSRALAADWKEPAELAAWKQRIRENWPHVRVDHVESSGIPDSPEVGGRLAVHAYLSLGALTPEDVDVQVVHGRVHGDDQIVGHESVSLALGEEFEAGRYRFDGHVELDRTGPFGYTVRVLPRHAALTAPAELGLVAHAG